MSNREPTGAPSAKVKKRPALSGKDGPQSAPAAKKRTARGGNVAPETAAVAKKRPARAKQPAATKPAATAERSATPKQPAAAKRRSVAAKAASKAAHKAPLDHAQGSKPGRQVDLEEMLSVAGEAKAGRAPTPEPSALYVRLGIAPAGSRGGATAPQTPTTAPVAAADTAEVVAATGAPTALRSVAAAPARQRYQPPPPPARPANADDPPLRRGFQPPRATIAAAGTASSAPEAPAPAAGRFADVASAATATLANPERVQQVDARTRRQRFAPEELAPPRAAAAALPSIAPRMSLLLVTRNHGAALEPAIAAWRARLPSFDLRIGVLDLGSVDHTLAVADSLHLDVIACPGGLVRPAEALLTGVRRTVGDVVLVADVDASPPLDAEAMVAAAREGGAIAVARGRRPGVLAIDARRVRDAEAAMPDPTANLAAIARVLAMPIVEVGDSPLDDDRALIGRLVDRRRRAKLRRAVMDVGQRLRRRLFAAR